MRLPVCLNRAQYSPSDVDVNAGSYCIMCYCRLVFLWDGWVGGCLVGLCGGVVVWLGFCYVFSAMNPFHVCNRGSRYYKFIDREEKLLVPQVWYHQENWHTQLLRSRR